MACASALSFVLHLYTIYALQVLSIIITVCVSTKVIV